MAKWSVCRTRNPVVPGFESRSGLLLDLFLVVPSSKSLATLVKNS